MVFLKRFFQLACANHSVPDVVPPDVVSLCLFVKSLIAKKLCAKNDFLKSGLLKQMSAKRRWVSKRAHIASVFISIYG